MACEIIQILWFLVACCKTCSSPVKVGLRSGAGEPRKCLDPALVGNQMVEFAALVCVPSVNLMEPRRKIQSSIISS